ncbi:hypothetical protein QNI23_013650 [Bermanella sp. WJH001]|uniref:hypothetical protein n=1 Tax=Bermanella sp. WJH001 TaxID=3048005 RepID=UPI0024BDDE91|nr:hypothetical protein [Bermanella sp. WJH001]MDJ1538037.1 hypothetical protein [Bermanella sp. WJH001]
MFITHQILRCVRFAGYVYLMLFAVAGMAENLDADQKGELKVQLSSFHELRGDYTTDDDEPLTVKIRSKMSGAYDVDVRFLLDDGELQAEFDLVSESMVLDGQNYILNAQQKHALGAASQALSRYLMAEYNDEFPEHSFLAVQMLAYWSKAPNDFPIGRREIETR